jgi:hypothetical protein
MAEVDLHVKDNPSLLHKNNTDEDFDEETIDKD